MLEFWGRGGHFLVVICHSLMMMVLSHSSRVGSWGPWIFTAKNPVYTSYSNAQPPTLYWQGGLDQVPGAGGNSLSSEFFDGDTRFYIVPDTFNPGGYHYEEALAGRDFIFEITDDLTITNNAILGGFEGYVNVFLSC